MSSKEKKCFHAVLKYNIRDREKLNKRVWHCLGGWVPVQTLRGHTEKVAFEQSPG